VKDLRIHRVVPPASVSLDSSSPECAALAKPVPVESTPLEAVSAAVVEDLERKPVSLLHLRGTSCLRERLHVSASDSSIDLLVNRPGAPPVQARA
jgi:hypothetical protein